MGKQKWKILLRIGDAIGTKVHMLDGLPFDQLWHACDDV
jgi:hypothetical protein